MKYTTKTENGKRSVTVLVANEQYTLNENHVTLKEAVIMASYVADAISERIQREHESAMFTKLKAGQSVEAINPMNGKIFTIRPRQWAGITMAYTVMVKGEVVPGYDGKMLDDATVKDWLSQLIEVEK